MMLAASLLEHAELHPEAAPAKPSKTAAPYLGMRIAHPHVRAADSGSQNRVRAGRRAAGERAGLQSDGEAGTSNARRAVTTNGLLERYDLGVWPTGGAGMPTSEDPFSTEHDRADRRIRKAPARRPSGLGERSAHGALGVHHVRRESGAANEAKNFA